MGVAPSARNAPENPQERFVFWLFFQQYLEQPFGRAERI